MKWNERKKKTIRGKSELLQCRQGRDLINDAMPPD